MEENGSFHRRVRRQVTGRPWRWIAVTPPGLAELCRRELDDLGMEGAEIVEAGVAFRGKLRDAWLANLWLRTASRVVCVFDSFRAGTREELFHKTAMRPWELWLSPEIPLRVWSFAERSRVSHEGLVKETVTGGIRKRFKDAGLPVPPALDRGGREWQQRIWVHLRRNQCVISLDTSGPHLHERGYRTVHCGAPLRETLAAGVLLKSGWSGVTPLVDGMCGAGTFTIEGALISRGLPPGAGRRYLFEKWPGFQEKTWKHLLRQGMEAAHGASPVPLVALDMDPGATAVARQNARNAGVEGDILFQTMDFFKYDPAAAASAPGLLALNPPYGKRLWAERGNLYTRLGGHLREAFQGWQVAVLAPDRGTAARLNLPTTRLWPMSHGGLDLLVVLGRVP